MQQLLLSCQTCLWSLMLGTCCCCPAHLGEVALLPGLCCCSLHPKQGGEGGTLPVIETAAGKCQAHLALTHTDIPIWLKQAVLVFIWGCGGQEQAAANASPDSLSSLGNNIDFFLQKKRHHLDFATVRVNIDTELASLLQYWHDLPWGFWTRKDPPHPPWDPSHSYILLPASLTLRPNLCFSPLPLCFFGSVSASASTNVTRGHFTQTTGLYTTVSAKGQIASVRREEKKK